MGNFLPGRASMKDALDESMHLVDTKMVWHHVANGGCLQEFVTAMDVCNPDYMKQRHPQFYKKQQRKATPVDKDARIKATAALRECFGLDQDRNPSPAQIKKEWASEYRWWTGMRRS
ncbi:hypothetical protein VPH35_126804 [Triticum aestivum]